MTKHILRTSLVLIGLLFSFSCKSQQKDQGGFDQQGSQLADSLYAYVKYKAGTYAFTNVRIIDGTGEPVREGQTLLIDNGIIKGVGNHSEVEIPIGTQTIDLSGKTIIPGLVGMHNHLHIPQFPYVGDIAAKLYLASGVTTIQTCGAASPARELELSRQIDQGLKIGPSTIASGPFITGPGGNPNMVIPKNEKHLRDTLQYWLDQGVKWFKVYRHIRPKDLETTIDMAHIHQAYVRGHLCSVTFGEAAKMGIDGIEHGLNSASDFRTDKDPGTCNGGREYMDSLAIDHEEVKNLQQLMIDNRVFLTSTLAIYEASVPSRAFADERTQKAMSPYLLDRYLQARERFDQSPPDATRYKRLQRIMAFEYQYTKMGGLLCSGVDAGRHVLPGFGDQRNFLLLLEAGFSPEEVIQIMTGNGTKALGRDDIGTIQVHTRADFVILDGNLVADPSIIREVETVFKAGIGFDPRKILEGTAGKFGIE